VKIYVTGVSGSGKSSIVRALTARGVRAIDLDEGYCHWKHRASGEQVGWEPGSSDEWYDAHGWICSIDDLTEALEGSADVVVVGLSSNQEEYLPLFDKIIILHSEPETIVARINARTDNEYGKHPKEQQRLLNWRETYEKEMVAKGAILLDGERHIDEVVEDVLKFLT
jgi:dephospho-CoA kinase